MPDLLLKGETCEDPSIIPAGHHGTNALPMAYKSKALNPSHTARPEPSSVSA